MTVTKKKQLKKNLVKVLVAITLFSSFCVLSYASTSRGSSYTWTKPDQTYKIYVIHKGTETLGDHWVFDLTGSLRNQDDSYVAVYAVPHMKIIDRSTGEAISVPSYEDSSCRWDDHLGYALRYKADDLPNGDYTIQCLMGVNTGTTDPVLKTSYDFTIGSMERTPPTISYEVKSDFTTVVITANDSSGISHMVVNGVKYESSSVTYKNNTLQPVEVIATDNAGNSTSKIIPITAFDNKAPDISKSINKQNRAVTFTVKDNVGIKNFNINGSNF